MSCEFSISFHGDAVANGVAPPPTGAHHHASGRRRSAWVPVGGRVFPFPFQNCFLEWRKDFVGRHTNLCLSLVLSASLALLYGTLAAVPGCSRNAPRIADFYFPSLWCFVAVFAADSIRALNGSSDDVLTCPARLLANERSRCWQWRETVLHAISAASRADQMFRFGLVLAAENSRQNGRNDAARWSDAANIRRKQT